MYALSSHYFTDSYQKRFRSLPFLSPLAIVIHTDILSQRKSLGDLTGEVFVNGQKPDEFSRNALVKSPP